MMQTKILKPKICRICGVEFIPNTGIQKYCGAECRKIGDREYNNGWYKKQRIMTIDEKIDRKIEVGLAKRERKAASALSLAEISRRAKDEHLTYGEYVLKHNI